MGRWKYKIQVHFKSFSMRFWVLSTPWPLHFTKSLHVFIASGLVPHPSLGAVGLLAKAQRQSRPTCTRSHHLPRSMDTTFSRLSSGPSSVPTPTTLSQHGGVTSSGYGRYLPYWCCLWPKFAWNFSPSSSSSAGVDPSQTPSFRLELDKVALSPSCQLHVFSHHNVIIISGGQCSIAGHWGVGTLNLVCLKNLTLTWLHSSCVLSALMSKECQAPSSSACCFSCAVLYRVFFAPNLPTFSISSKDPLYLPLINRSLLWSMVLTLVWKLVCRQ